MLVLRAGHGVHIEDGIDGHRQVNNLRSSEGLEAGGAPRA